MTSSELVTWSGCHAQVVLLTAAGLVVGQRLPASQGGMDGERQPAGCSTEPGSWHDLA